MNIWDCRLYSNLIVKERTLKGRCGLVVQESETDIAPLVVVTIFIKFTVVLSPPCLPHPSSSPCRRCDHFRCCLAVVGVIVGHGQDIKLGRLRSQSASPLRAGVVCSDMGFKKVQQQGSSRRKVASMESNSNQKKSKSLIDPSVAWEAWPSHSFVA
jgi:hypothetical protein